MQRALLVSATIATTVLSAAVSWAEGNCAAAPSPTLATWGVSPVPLVETRGPAEEAPLGRAREFLARAKILDETATQDEKRAAEVASRLAALHVAAKTARDRANQAPDASRDAATAKAEELEADLLVSEAEVVTRRRSATENRRLARELRARAVKLATDPSVEDGSSCNPPFQLTAEGWKKYRLECLR